MGRTGRRLTRDVSGLDVVELVAALVEPSAPGALLDAARATVGSGALPWLLAEPAAAVGGPRLTPRQALRLQLATELIRRVEEEGGALAPPIQGPRDVLPHLLDIRSCNQERVVALYLDARNRPVHRELVAAGGLRASVLQPRDVLGPALRLPVLSLVLAHNHPSGDTRPSPEDVEVTRQLSGAASLLGLTLADHLVVSGMRYTSLRELGII